MIDWKEISGGDSWELFARDFLAEIGFVIELGPGRGPDAGRDLVVSEQLTGTLATRKFRWLVSCKHKSVSGTAVGSEEVDLTDRLRRNDCQGFLGFYSTMASASLIDRLNSLYKSNEIDAFEIFDGSRIESRIIASGLTKIVLSHLPFSYGKLRPIQRFFKNYMPLKCEVCDRDVIDNEVAGPPTTILVWASNDSSASYHSVHVCCRGDCDQNLSDRLYKQGYITGWEDIGDLSNPILYMRNIMAYMNHLHEDQPRYSAKAHEKMKEIYLTLAQITLREVTEEDEQRVKDLKSFDLL